jgi:HD-GYP domain-containing protein (c-di-GMP phosphodiesterase class II)
LKNIDTEAIFWEACDTVGISGTNQQHLRSLLAPLRDKDPITNFHYLHSLRVGLLARQIGSFIHHEEKPLLLAGTLHDLGKCQTCLRVLGKTGSWSDADQEEIEQHVLDGYRLLRGRFDYSAEIMLWHHRFQENGYPEELPSFLHKYRQTTQLLIREYGRIVAIADVYDALHRVNEKVGEARALTSTEIREKMFEYNPDRKKLVIALYSAGILT